MSINTTKLTLKIVEKLAMETMVLTLEKDIEGLEHVKSKAELISQTATINEIIKNKINSFVNGVV